MPHLFCFGLGYTATALGKSLLQKGWQISGTCQTEDKRQEMTKLGFQTVLFDGNNRSEDVTALLNSATHILQSIAPDAEGDPVLRVFAEEIRARSTHIQWLGYLSTTAVYGDRQGGWVDETSELIPQMPRSIWRVQAEQQWRSLLNEETTPVHIFRLAGIYGPGRNQLKKLLAKKARRIVRKGQLFSRIHVEDIAQVLSASIHQPNPGAVYNVCDNEAAPPQDVIKYAAKLLGIDPPPAEAFDDAEMSEMARSFYSESKKVSNQKIITELGVKLKYPTYREGMRSLITAINLLIS
jgi:nucleoside-diphosphate-sugar epimerase